jgi:hypothetical protein
MVTNIKRRQSVADFRVAGPRRQNPESPGNRALQVSYAARGKQLFSRPIPATRRPT